MFTFVDEPKTCRLPDTNKLDKKLTSELTVNEPVIVELAFTCKPFASTDAVTAPLTILFNSNPVTPLAGILYNP